MKVQFQYPQALWALTLVPVFMLLFILYGLWRRKVAMRIGEPRLVKESYKNYSSLKSIIKFCLLLIAFSCGCIAIANPRRADMSSAEARQGIDVVVALDVSNSMMATDISPNRLTLAKQLVQQLINKLPNDRIGLVLFAGTAYLQMPLTFDHAAAQLFISTASTGTIEAQGTAIGDALQKGKLAFGKESDRYKTIVLITDGETHDNNAVPMAKTLASEGVIINTVGIGTAVGATITDTATHSPKKDVSGTIVLSKLNEALLQQLAAATNGQYVHLQNAAAAANELVQQFAGVQTKAMADTSKLAYHTFYVWLAVPMLLLLLTETFFPDRKKVNA